MLLQLGYVDTLVSALLGRLHDQNMFEEAMVVVVSDHGMSFGAGAHRRGALDASDGTPSPIATADLAGKAGDEVLPIPLFVKYPGQTSGFVDNRRAESIDVLPTIADTLDVTLPEGWAFDGRSLTSAAPPLGAPGHWVTGAATDQDVSFAADPIRMARDLREWFGPPGGPHDIYAVGPYGDLVGERVGELVGWLIAPPVDGARVMQGDTEAFENVHLGGPSVPALYSARVFGVDDGSWLALALDGTVAGVGPVYNHRDGYPYVEIMADPSLMSEGANEIEVFLIEADGAGLRPIASG
jgi:hypothetical protein